MSSARGWRRLLGVAVVQFVILEVALRFAVPFAPVKAQLELRSQGVEGFYGRYAYDPVTGWANRPGDVIGGGVTAHNNQWGFRGPEPEPSSAPRLLLLGDSFAYGQEVADDETFAWHLDQSGLNVVNTAVPGFGHDQMLLTLRRVAPDHSPDVVVLAYVPMDVSRNLRSHRGAPKPRYYLDDLGILVEPGPVAAPGAGWTPRLYSVEIGEALVRWVDTKVPPFSGWRVERGERLTLALFGALTSEAARYGARLVLVYLPTRADLRESMFPSRDRALFDNICSVLDVDCVDTTPALKALGAPLFRDTHYGPEAHAAIARVILQAGLNPTETDHDE